jgi:catechol 2,3-dioxygenase-like lactoylglutathione lyase family enzyme
VGWEGAVGVLWLVVRGGVGYAFGMELLSSRLLIRVRNPEVTTAFYRDVLGLAVYRQFPGGTVFFLGGGGFLEISGGSDAVPTEATQLWLQVRDLTCVAAEFVGSDVRVLRGPKRESWGLDEMWIADPNGLRIVLVEVPADHPLRTDVR